MNNYIEYVLVIPVIVILYLVLLPISRKLGLVDTPRGRKTHMFATPLVGGIGVFITINFFNFLFVEDFDQVFFISSLIIFLTGLIDDFKDLKVYLRVALQVFSIVLLIIGNNLLINDFGTLFFIDKDIASNFGLFFSLFAIIGLVNAFNLVDGIDGLAASMALITIASLLFLVLYSGQLIHFDIMIFSLLSLLVFLFFNLGIFGKNSKIFLGDAGSLYIGLLIAFLLVSISQSSLEVRILNPVTTLWIVAIPIFDTIAIMIRRILKGQSPFLPDRRHLHHILLKLGLDDRSSLIFISTLGLILSIFGILLDIYKFSETLSLILWIILFLAYLLFILRIYTIFKYIKKIRKSKTIN